MWNYTLGNMDIEGDIKMRESLEIDCNCTYYLEHVGYTKKGEIVCCWYCGSKYYNLNYDLVWIDNKKC